MVVNSHKITDADIKTCEYCQSKILPSEQYCKGCKIYISLGNKTVKRHEKELTIKAVLEEAKIDFTHDLIVKDGCSRKRPDFVILTTWGTIILEIDEHQHNRKTYPCVCEITRMKQLYYDCGVANLLFIRYNPDAYKPLTSIKEEPSRFREDFLIRYIKNRMDKIDDFKHLGVVYLFYDGFELSSCEIEKIDIV
jgi:hypothetical protein